MMSTSAAMHPAVLRGAENEGYTERAVLLRMARALRFGSESRAGERLAAPVPGRDGEATSESGERAGVPDDALPGPRWIAGWFAEQVDALRALLADTERHWHIEGDAAARAQMRSRR